MTRIGIDLGTTNSGAAFHDGLSAQIIELASGHPTMPSVVSLDAADVPIVGRRALKKAIKDPQFTFANFKRHIGKAYTDGEDYGPQVVPGTDGQRWYQGRTRLWAPEEFSAEILKALKARAEERLAAKVTGAVITVPAYFDNNRIEATRAAGKQAGFRKVDILTEPEAAVLAYGLNRSKFSRVVVVDLGGGTFDIVLAEVGKGYFRPLAKSGNDQLGGVDWDRRIRNRLVEQFQAQHGRDLPALSQLRLEPEAENAKKELTEADQAMIDVWNVSLDPNGGGMQDVRLDLAREEFEALTADLVTTMMAIVQRTLASVDMPPEKITDVLLVGGMTRVPAVRAAVSDYFGAARLRDSVPVDLVVAIGAAIKAAELDGRLTDKMAIDDVAAHAFGFEDNSGRFQQVIPKGAPFGRISTVEVTNAQDGQDVIPIAVLQGESPVARENTVLARYDHRIAPCPAGEAAVELEFMLDDEGLAMVAGRDLATGETFSILKGGKS